jgi:hypothetical protein
VTVEEDTRHKGENRDGTQRSTFKMEAQLRIDVLNIRPYAENVDRALWEGKSVAV